MKPTRDACQLVKLAERRPYRECRKKPFSYKDLSSEESDNDFHDVDSSFNQTLEPEHIEDEKRLIKNRPVGRRLAEVTRELAGCKLDGSSIVYESEDETVAGHVVGGPEGSAVKAINMPADPPVVVDFEDENGQDGEKALDYSRTLTMPFCQEDITFWFTQLENEMFTCTIRSQWMKRVVLVKNLPPKVQMDVKSLLVLKQSEAPADIYKKVKTELLRLYAPKQEENFKKALGRVMTGLPSQLGQVLINDICDKPVKLQGCCCAKAVYTLWALQLPLSVRSQIATKKFDYSTYSEVFQAADTIYLSTKSTDLSASVAAIAVTAKDEVPEVAAFKPKKNKNKKDKKPKEVSENCCDNHKKWADKAWFCLDPTKCPMKDKNVPRPEKDEKDKKKK